MEEANLIFPNQLFEKSPLFNKNVKTFLIEEHLFFKHFKFHKKKIFFHRVSMKKYFDYCLANFDNVEYVESCNENSDIRVLLNTLLKKGIKKINYIDPCDNWLNKRIKEFSKSININIIESPQFLNSNEENLTFFNPDKKKYFQTSFYKLQRKKMNILMIGDNPEGGKWTYDDENRKKYPKNKIPPKISYPKDETAYVEDANLYIKNNFKNNYGSLNQKINYPTDFQTAKNWLSNFLKHRFIEFGDYEDAIVQNELILNHSVLSPLINCGLLTPSYVVNELNEYATKKNIPINSYEGIIRQIIGWREFIRGVYISKGGVERTKNYWGFTKKMPDSFYTATTGVKPVDDCINKLNDSAYLHHIERLMVLGNFMFLCEINPDDVYKWFMELFIDSYDWVMVPNVYGMSQFADGGTFATKPYIGGSNYIKKMSNYGKGPWTDIWDGLFWRFISANQDFFLKNPRMSMMVHSFNRMSDEKRALHLGNAAAFLAKIDEE